MITGRSGSGESLTRLEPTRQDSAECRDQSSASCSSRGRVLEKSLRGGRLRWRDGQFHFGVRGPSISAFPARRPLLSAGNGTAETAARWSRQAGTTSRVRGQRGARRSGGVAVCECGNKRFISGSQAIPCHLIHPTMDALDVCPISVRFVAKEGVDPLPMDVSGPLRAKWTVRRQMQKNIPHRCGIEDVGVEKGGEARHRAPYPMSSAWASRVSCSSTCSRSRSMAIL